MRPLVRDDLGDCGHSRVIVASQHSDLLVEMHKYDALDCHRRRSDGFASEQACDGP